MILFFFSKINCIDHMTPVVDRLARDGFKDSMRLFTVNMQEDLRSDHRLRFLHEQHGLKVEYPFEYGRRDREQQRFFSLYRTLMLGRKRGGAASLNKQNKIKRVVWDSLSKLAFRGRDISQVFSEDWAKSFLLETEARTLVFDVSAGLKKSSKTIIQMARELKIPVIALPNACNIAADGSGRQPEFTPGSFAQFDRIIIHRQGFAQSLVDAGLDQRKIRIIGSARFNREWHERYLQYIRRAMPVPYKKDPKRPNVLLLMNFLPMHEFRGLIQINQGRHLRDLQMSYLTTLNDISGLNLILKPHPSFNRKKGAPGEVEELEVKIDTDSDTLALCDWADIVINVNTSSILNAFLLGKPVVNLVEVEGVGLASSAMGCSIDVHSKEELPGIIEALIASEYQPPYSNENTERLLAWATADGHPERDVLGEYEQMLVQAAFGPGAPQ